MAEPLYLDDLQTGDTFKTGTHEMTEQGIIAFASQFDPQPFHTDPEAARQSLFGELAASGWHTAAISMRLLVEALPLAKGMIGTEAQMQWPTPTRVGDILHATAEVGEIVPSKSHPGRASVSMHCLTYNQHGELRQDFRSRVIVWTRDADPKA